MMGSNDRGEGTILIVEYLDLAEIIPTKTIVFGNAGEALHYEEQGCRSYPYRYLLPYQIHTGEGQTVPWRPQKAPLEDKNTRLLASASSVTRP